MHTLHAHSPGARTSTALLLLSVGLLSSGCASQAPLAGTWSQHDATTALPDDLGGEDLLVDAVLTMNDATSPPTFELHLALSFMELSDTIDAEGTYADDGQSLTFSFEGFSIDPASGNTASVAEDGGQCIVLMGFGGAGVCFPSPQAHAYSRGADTLSITLDQAIAGAPVSSTHLVLVRTE